MPDLIDREKLISEMEDTKLFGMCMFRFPKNQINVAEAVADAMLDNIKDAPTVDAVPVVRCKDCRFGIAHKYGIYCPLLAYTRPGDWFCANGERKRKEDTHET